MDRADRKNAIGFALSGGGLQGIAHIGALKALYELGIRPQFVSGTSSGAAMAAICSSVIPAARYSSARRCSLAICFFHSLPLCQDILFSFFGSRPETKSRLTRRRMHLPRRAGDRGKTRSVLCRSGGTRETMHLAAPGLKPV